MEGGVRHEPRVWNSFARLVVFRHLNERRKKDNEEQSVENENEEEADQELELEEGDSDGKFYIRVVRCVRLLVIFSI